MIVLFKNSDKWQEATDGDDDSDYFICQISL